MDGGSGSQALKSISEKSPTLFLGICSLETLREARKGHWLCGVVVSVPHEGTGVRDSGLGQSFCQPGSSARAASSHWD